jgi:hypothetical protein
MQIIKKLNGFQGRDIVTEGTKSEKRDIPHLVRMKLQMIGEHGTNFKTMRRKRNGGFIMDENSASENIKKRITEYVLDDRKQQAILLDGDWGCGKTYFVNEKLIPALKNIDDIQVYKISLYGVSDTDTIQDMIYANWIEKILSDRTEKLGTAGKVMAKSVGLFGKNALKAIEEKAGVGSSATDITDSILDSTMGKKKRMVLIFDDIERCRIEIVELMGFLNNLSENNGYRLILVANEKEISNIPNNQELALKYIVALNQNIDIEDNKNRKNVGTKDISFINKEELVKRSDLLFGTESTYERTREKLIGITIPYNVSLEESFDFIIEKYIKFDEIRNYVSQNKNSIVEIFNNQTHRNLRTLIAACIAWDDVIAEVNKIKVENESYKEEEKNKILKYIAVSAIRRSNGKKDFIWKDNLRFGIINNSLFTSDVYKIYGYAFVDEYLRNQCLNVISMENDIKTIIAEKMEIEKSEKKSKDHNSLSMFKLIDWYYMEEKEVSSLVESMKTELKEKKYYPSEFKDIIITLMRINNVNFGLVANVDTRNDDAVFDSSEGVQFENYYETNKKVVEHQYEEWRQINIQEFINLMLDYFENGEYKITTNMIRVLSEDKSFAYEYRELTMPILEKIEKIELDRIMKSDMDIVVSGNIWDEEFVSWCENHKSKYKNKGRFISLFDIKALKEKLTKANAKEIHNFCDALKAVYSFSNLYDVFTADYDIIRDLKLFIDENEVTKINPQKSRAKEIAIFRLKGDLEQYMYRLEKENFTI